jgi:hypothetical protein
MVDEQARALCPILGLPTDQEPDSDGSEESEAEADYEAAEREYQKEKLGARVAALRDDIDGAIPGSAGWGVKDVFYPPEYLLTSFHTILVFEFGVHLPTLPSC